MAEGRGCVEDVPGESSNRAGPGRATPLPDALDGAEHCGPTGGRARPRSTEHPSRTPDKHGPSEVVGFSVVKLGAPIAGAWDLLAASPRGLTLIAAVMAPPNLVGAACGAVPGWPAGTVRLILVWSGAPLPRAIML